MLVPLIGISACVAIGCYYLLLAHTEIEALKRQQERSLETAKALVHALNRQSERVQSLTERLSALDKKQVAPLEQLSASDVPWFAAPLKTAAPTPTPAPTPAREVDPFADDHL